MRYYVFLIGLLLMGYCLQAQETNHSKIESLGLSYQFYPAGHIITVFGEVGFAKRNAFNFRLGGNFADRRDWGEHQHEKGAGAGLSFGYNHYFKDDLQGFFLGIQSDCWFLKIDWTDQIGELNETKGQTSITILQPSLGAGYRHLFNDKWSLSAAVNFGFEINVHTKGEEVGQGPILLIGSQFAYRL